jgi:hypothetical protein
MTLPLPTKHVLPRKRITSKLTQLIMALFASCPVAASADTLNLIKPLELKTSYEQWQLPGNESTGMAAVGIQAPISEWFSVGVEARSATAGNRGGFITLGIAGELVYPLTRDWALEAGLSVGAGGGRGGAYLSGGGLMIHQHAGVRYAVPDIGLFSLGYSSVEFPNDGAIRSNQPYVGYSLPFYALLEPGTNNRQQRSPGWITFSDYSPHRHQMMFVTRGYMTDAAVKDVNGNAAPNMGLVGVEWRTFIDDNWFIRGHTEAAAQGSSAGYMQVMGGAGRSFRLNRHIELLAAVSVGGGGGGAVESGGGFLVDGTVGAQWHVTPQWFAEISAGRIMTPASQFSATSIDARIGYQLGRSAKVSELSADEMLDDHPLRLRVGSHQYQKASENWRTEPHRNVDNLAIQLDYFVSPRWFLTGQGIGAYAGGAGAYMTGLVGAGVRQEITQAVFVEGELLAGAAGGGGLNTGSGLLSQANLSLGWQLTPSIAVLGSMGRAAAIDGPFSANVFGISVAHSLNMYTPKVAK